MQRTLTIQRFATGIGLAVLLSSTAAQAMAGVDLFTEDFTSSSANWANFNSSNFLTHVPSGGPDGGAFASGPRSFQGQAAGNTPVALRARHDDPWNSSNDAFVGNWITEGIREVRVFLRHDAPDPLTFFARVAGTANFPGHVYSTGVLVPPNTWAEHVFDVSRYSSQLVSPEGSDYQTVFSNVGHLQFGAVVPAGYSANPTFFNLGIDKVTIATPEPTAIAVAVTGLLGLIGVRVRHRVRTSQEQ